VSLSFSSGCADNGSDMVTGSVGYGKMSLVVAANVVSKVVRL
jgi:hypothetical protein